MNARKVDSGVPVRGSHGQSDASGRELNRIRKAFLATKRIELLTPVHAIVDVSERLLSHVIQCVELPEEFIADLRVIHLTAEELLEMIGDVLNPDRMERAGADEDFEELQSRVRHDMLNKLNPIINYSEMWMEESDDPEIRSYSSDLQLICDSGRRCHSLIGRIVKSLEAETFEFSDGDMQLVSGAVGRMFDPDGEPSTQETGRLLVVDDNETNRRILERRLLSQGHDVALAENGTDALRMLAERPFDLVLLDILMPEIDGFDVLVRMKSDERLRDIPVIMISALDATDVVVRCIQAGAEDYLPKPFNPVMLKARVSACLEKKRLREREKEHLRQIERERRRADELLHVILPSSIVAELKRENRVRPRRYENVAVLFADIVNFTPYCDRNAPEEVMSLLQRLVVAWEESALRHNVEKIKTIGDAFMAASGLLNRRGDPVLNCLRCGVEMIESTRKLASEWNLRVGIHCGQVVGGILGQRQYLFDLWGDTVNTAARMESGGKPGSITMSEVAWRVVEHHCIGSCIRKVLIKGKGPMDIYCFEGFKERASESSEARDVRSPVGG